MQEDRLRTLLDLTEQIAQQSPNRTLVLVRGGANQWVAALVDGLPGGVIQLHLSNAAYRGSPEAALEAFITERR